MFHVVLYQPEIPPNTGNIIRLCANAGATLHLIHPLGFTLEEKALRRAGLDYHDLASVRQYDSWEEFFKLHQQKNIYALSSKAKTCYSKIEYTADDYFLFGPETRGLPAEVMQQCTTLTIPMRALNRSLNLSNSVAIVLYEAWRQLDFQ